MKAIFKKPFTYREAALTLDIQASEEPQDFPARVIKAAINAGEAEPISNKSTKKEK